MLIMACCVEFNKEHFLKKKVPLFVHVHVPFYVVLFPVCCVVVTCYVKIK